MLDVLILVLLAIRIGQRAADKGLSKTRWMIYTVVSWIFFEFLGILLAVALFGLDNFFAIASIGLMSAVGGYLLVRFQLEKQAGTINDDIDQIGS